MAAWGGGVAYAQSSNDKLARIMEQVRAAAGDPSAAARKGAVPPERLAERTRLLREGEAALVRGEPEAAERAFDAAALILHAADTELGLVRTYMQKGEYRRALAFGAHTAGAHLDAVGGAALYAWLLDLGAQGAFANRLLAEAAARAPGNPVVAEASAQLKSGRPLAGGVLLAAPVRLAPYAAGQPPAARAQVVASALLVDGGRHAVVPASAVKPRTAVWLRNGLGQTVAARVERTFGALGLSLLRLDQALPAPADASAVARDVFPGSVGHAVDYVASADAEPRWPMLRSGFIGAPAEGAALRELGIELPAGPRGGPVFDAGGRLAGIAMASPEGPDRLVPASALGQALGVQFGWGTARGSAGAAADQVYEAALKSALQVITVR